MSTDLTVGHGIDIVVENVGGIDETEVSLQPGVSLLVGRNATNRTSLLQALMLGLGSDRGSIKADAQQGRVELTVDDETFERTLTVRDGTVTSDGDRFLNDPTKANLFAFLLESNEARRAIALDDNLREIIMRPVDTDAIQAEIDRLSDEKRKIEAQLEDLEEDKQRLPRLETEREELQTAIDETRAAIQEKEAEIKAADVDIEESRADQTALQETLDELRETRSELETVRYKIETRQESLERLREERADLIAERDDLEDVSEGRLANLDDEIDHLRTRQDAIETELGKLQNLIQFNENMLDGVDTDPLSDPDDDGGTLTDQLVGDERVCWTCGSRVQASQIEQTVDELRDRRQERLHESRRIDDELAGLKDESDQLRQQQQRHEEIRRRLATIDDDIADTEERIADFEARREDLTDEVAALETEASDIEQNDYSGIIELHKEANELEFELERQESELSELNDRIAAIEDRLQAEAELREDLESVETALSERRTRMERIESDAVEAFNDHMQTVLELLDYANLERIWLERSHQKVREGRQTVTRSTFDLHVVRSTQSGTVYEDTVDNLSESEREVTGLVFALAGYLAHEVHEEVPFLLLDSVEAIDSDRIAALVEYIAEYAEYLVVALLPEDAAALDDSYRRITDI